MATPRKYVVQLTAAEIETLRRLLQQDTCRLLDERKDLAAYRLRLRHYAEIEQNLGDALLGPRRIVAGWGEERPAFTQD